VNLPKESRSAIDELNAALIFVRVKKTAVPAVRGAASLGFRHLRQQQTAAGSGLSLYFTGLSI